MNKDDFEPVRDKVIEYQGCKNRNCDRFSWFKYLAVIWCFDYLEDGFSFIKLVK